MKSRIQGPQAVIPSFQLCLKLAVNDKTHGGLCYLFVTVIGKGVGKRNLHLTEGDQVRGATRFG